MNNPFHYKPTQECDEAFRRLEERVSGLKGSPMAEDRNFCRELEAGKMLGVLIAEDAERVRHTLYAFSGQLGDGGFYHPGFVGPVFDYLEPDGYFKTQEAEISRQNTAIKRFEADILGEIRSGYTQAKERMDARMAELKERNRRSKSERDAKREAGNADEAEIAAMTRQSQYEKAELNRLKKKLAAELEPFAIRLREGEAQLMAMKEKRRADSEALQGWLFDNFKVLNARGESRSLSEIFEATALKVAPSGAGECCGPKLLHAAYGLGLKPVAMAEYWYGRPKGGEVRVHGEHYPACRGKCLPVLGWMLQGLTVEPPLGDEERVGEEKEPEILYENEWFCVVDKPSGMLSVPGKGVGMSVERWLQQRYGAERDIKMVHRLDQDTSGLLIASFGAVAYRELQKMFATRKVRKTYVAELDGDFEASGVAVRGRIDLPLSPDWLDRPRQKVDHDGGKESVTEYEFIRVAGGRSRVEFHPLTGRTHQLRVHSASAEGLGMPIAGDRLYGRRGGEGAERLMLHAHRIEFTFPLDGKRYGFESPAPF